MPERTAAEVLAEKISAIWGDLGTKVGSAAIAARLAEDPAITVRTDMVVERFVVEIHRISPAGSHWSPQAIFMTLTTSNYFSDRPDRRIIVRPYPEATKPNA